MEVKVDQCKKRTTITIPIEYLFRNMGVTYRQTDQPTEVFQQWLNSNLPSSTYSSDGISWITVQGPNVQDISQQRDSERLDQLWDEVQRSNRPINVDLISNLAEMCHYTTGKWLFHVDTGPKADHIWSLVATAIVKGDIPSFTAKISPVDDEDEDEGDGQHVVCIYNYNYLDQDQVLECENEIRRIGIKCPLMYKPDVFTRLGIYPGNPWNLRPTLYRSEYNVLTRQSVVDLNYASRPKYQTRFQP